MYTYTPKLTKDMTQKKILIIDDDKEFLEELKETLILNGYDVVGMSESISAIKIAKAVNPDLILLDLKMSAMSGFEVADGLKRIPETSQIPIIAMTGFYTMKEHSWLMNFCDIKKCLKKPFNPQDVITEIELILGAKKEEV